MESALMQGKRLRKLKKREGESVKTIRCFSRFFFNYSFFLQELEIVEETLAGLSFSAKSGLKARNDNILLWFYSI